MTMMLLLVQYVKWWHAEMSSLIPEPSLKRDSEQVTPTQYSHIQSIDSKVIQCYRVPKIPCCVPNNQKSTLTGINNIALIQTAKFLSIRPSSGTQNKSDKNAYANLCTIFNIPCIDIFLKLYSYIWKCKIYLRYSSLFAHMCSNRTYSMC
jgi:hypothetical protein